MNEWRSHLQSFYCRDPIWKRRKSCSWISEAWSKLMNLYEHGGIFLQWRWRGTFHSVYVCPQTQQNRRSNTREKKRDCIKSSSWNSASKYYYQQLLPWKGEIPIQESDKLEHTSKWNSHEKENIYFVQIIKHIRF